MNSKNFHNLLNTSTYFIDNINDKKEQNDNEIKLSNYNNRNINPPFRYYNDDANLNLSLSPVPKFTYKNKSLFHREKPIQTEQDQIGINESYLNNHFGYKDYGNFNVANQSLPEINKHKTTPKNYLFELI